MSHPRALPPAPDRCKKLPIAPNGYPVPWFVTWFEGKPDFRVADSEKRVRAVTERRCWVCGQPLARPYAFVVGPMCAVNRVSADPPSHPECGKWAAQACPFMARPHMRRREADLPAGVQDADGEMIKRNPGVALVWLTRSYTVTTVHNGWLIDMGPPVEVSLWAHGRVATPKEIHEAVVSGLPLLMEPAQRDGPAAIDELCTAIRTGAKTLGLNASAVLRDGLREYGRTRRLASASR